MRREVGNSGRGGAGVESWRTFTVNKDRTEHINILRYHSRVTVVQTIPSSLIKRTLSDNI